LGRKYADVHLSGARIILILHLIILLQPLSKNSLEGTVITGLLCLTGADIIDLSPQPLNGVVKLINPKVALVFIRFLNSINFTFWLS